MKSKEIKPKYKWCVYGLAGKHVGKVVSWSPTTVEVLYTQNQHYPTELWDNHPAYIRCFVDIKAALAYYLTDNPNNACTCDLLEFVVSDFDDIGRYIKRRGRQLVKGLEKNKKARPCRHG